MVIAQNRRWFIWAIVVLVVVGVGVTAYIMSANLGDQVDASSGLLTHRVKKADVNTKTQNSAHTTTNTTR